MRAIPTRILCFVVGISLFMQWVLFWVDFFAFVLLFLCFSGNYQSGVGDIVS